MSTRKPTPSENLDVIKYQESLIAFMRTFPQFTDYDFKGANLDVLMRLLSFNTYNNAHMSEMIGNEAWVDTAMRRHSLVSHATDLNYLPRSRISASSSLTLEIIPDDNPSSIIVPKYYKFKTNDSNGNILYFVTDKEYVATRDMLGRYIISDVNIYQGEVIEDRFLVEGVRVNGAYTVYDTPFIISNEAVDIKSIEVFVAQSENDTNPEKYILAKTLGETTSASRTFFLRGIYDNQYAVEFGDGTFGLPIANGNVVTIRYRATNGAVTQGMMSFSKTTAIDGYSNIIITNVGRVQGGFERETIEEIRQNSTKHFQVQDRAVTSSDYVSIIKENFPSIQQVTAFGGEEILQYGKVIIVLKPYGVQGIVPDIVKKQIIELLKTKNIVPEPKIIDPEYYYIEVDGNVFYKGDWTDLNEQQLSTNIIRELTLLNNDVIANFGAIVYQSTINSTIKSSDTSITGADIRMSLIKRWYPTLNINDTITMDTGIALVEPSDGDYMSVDDYTLITDPFTIFINGALTRVSIQDDGGGNLHYYELTNTGRKFRIGQSIGTIDYKAGKVQFNSSVRDYSGNYISIIVKLKDDSIQAKLNNFFILDGADIHLKLHRG